jgi:hypothetical protein
MIGYFALFTPALRAMGVGIGEKTKNQSIKQWECKNRKKY